MSEKYETITQTAEVRKYKPFEGRNIDQMPILLAEGRTLITPKQLIKVRLSGMPGDKENLRDNYADVDVAVLPNPDGDDVKLVIAHPLTKTLSPNSRLKNSGLPITHEHYDSHEGLVISGSDANEFRNNPYALPNKRREVWEFLAEGQDLSNDYEKDVTESLGLNYDNVMGLWFPDTKEMRLLCVGAVRGGDGPDTRSDAGGDADLAIYSGRLFGVAPEAQIGERSEQLRAQNSASESPLEDRVQAALSAGKAFKYNGKLYVPTDANLEIKE